MLRIRIIGSDEQLAKKIEDTILFICAQDGSDREAFPDCLFLMGRDGQKDFEKAERIWEKDSAQLIVYVARCPEDVFKALPYPFFHVVREFALEQDLRAALQKLSRSRPAEKWQTFSCKSGMLRVKQKSILYLESRRHEIEVHLERSPNMQAERIVTMETLESLEQRLKPAGFARIHKSFLVNLDRVVKLEKDRVTLEGGEQLYISRYRYPEVKLQFEQFIRHLDFL